jgi:hypothetical protein
MELKILEALAMADTNTLRCDVLYKSTASFGDRLDELADTIGDINETLKAR